MSEADSKDIITVLHISDFHFTKRKQRDQQIVVAALLQDLKANCLGYRKPDLVMFTGDLVHAGGVDRHDEAYDFILSKVANAVGVSEDKIFIAPGNHDVDTSMVDGLLGDHTSWREAANDPSKLNALYEQGHFEKANISKLKNYYELEDYISGGSRVYRNNFGSVYRLPDINLDLIVFDTAVFSKGGSKNLSKDEGYMAIPEFAALELLGKLTGDLCIAVTHHPLSALSEATAKFLRHKLQAHAQLHLFGHMHDPDSENIQGLNGSVYANQAGAICTHRTDYYIGYSLISYSRSKGAVETLFRSYFPERDCFDAALDRIGKGLFYPNPESRHYYSNQVTPFDEDELKSHLLEIGLQELFQSREGVESEKDVAERFVAPPPL